MKFFNTPLYEQSSLRENITRAYRMDEAHCVNTLLEYLQFSQEQHATTQKLARKLIETVRQHETEKSGIDALMAHYDLSTEEGVLLMCLAEALLRIPDAETEKLLIQDKLTSANWKNHLGASESSFVNMATWGLALSGKVLKPSDGLFQKVWQSLLRKGGEPVIRQAVREAIKVMSKTFVLGRNIDEALKRSQEMMQKGYTYSYDMLGEVARTRQDADKYFAAYQKAITAVSKTGGETEIFKRPSISVKLSALHPRYEFGKYETVVPQVTERLTALALQAKAGNISLTIDAEEADRLELSLAIIENVLLLPELKGWDGLGLAVQAYQKRALPLVQWLIELGRQHGKRIRVRLVKGAYWDTEVKLTQVMGFNDYPVFTRKMVTDVSYLACAKLLLSAQDAIYPQFATHNAYSVAAILTMMGDYKKYQFEFQNLQGMGKSLHDIIVDKGEFNIPTRIYAPVGSHEDLLPYLVRRLLENGANSSFVNQLSNESIPVGKLIQDPITSTKALEHIPNRGIPLPENIYGKDRLNSHGVDFSNHDELAQLANDMSAHPPGNWHSSPFNQKIAKEKAQAVTDPSDRRRIVGYTMEATKTDVEQALCTSIKAFTSWNGLGVDARAQILLKMADLLETHHAELMSMAVSEAGKILADAMSEVREATDFCRYYSVLARDTLHDETMPGPTGESNVLRQQGRGTILCISPWNFPIAIFTGQVAAALVAGNTVIAKPAEQTTLIAARIVQLFYEAGVPKEALILLPGRGEVVGAALVEDPRVSGVLFTGSTETAKAIQKGLTNRPGPIVPLIAETGGINVMIADSTALPEQLIRDVVLSAFGSAGQRCSALRVLFIQDDVADGVIEMLAGAMQEITLGDPQFLATDVGPVIDEDAKSMLEAHAATMYKEAELIHRVELPAEAQNGTFFAPHAFLLSNLSELKREVFGPMLHVIRYKRKDLDKVIDEINALGYGLTFGIQSRINSTVDYIQSRVRAGNIYVNRNMIGAVVGVQPFGGSRLSGTGPKAGGPHYLTRLTDESTLTIDTTAAGGNASLMALSDE